ncbi:MAG: hypothetical protein WC956_01470 [bacterium]
MRMSRKYVGMFIVVSFMFVAAVCKGGDTKSSPKIILEKGVSVAGGGGGAELSFNATKGQKIRISLKASSSSMEPYGFLERSGAGGGEYRPPLENSKGGENEAEVFISKGGRYSLTIFDGSNAGGNVRVVITAL